MNRIVKRIIRTVAGKIAGVNKVQEQIDTIFIFLNYYCDIREFPKPTGPLGQLQEGDTLLLKIVDCICKKHNLEYWLDAGTCLGAVRHQGFIPWDDDMDICMLRDDYERAVPILKEELGKYGIDALESSRDAAARIGIGYMHSKTGIWIDLRPYECLREDFTQEPERKKLVSRIKRYSRFYLRKREHLSREEVFALQKRYVGQFCKKEEATTLIRTMEFDSEQRMWHYDDFFPLKRVIFEGAEFPIPKNSDAFLRQFFGDEYMGFPRDGMEHHGGKQGKLKTWAAQSGTDMDQVIMELKKILDAVSNAEQEV